MRTRLAEVPLLVVLLGFSGALALVPAAHAVAVNETRIARGFLYSALILILVAVMLGIATSSRPRSGSTRSHLAALVGAYAILPLAMALPMLETVRDTRLANAWFEMVSAFTLTGATAYPAERLAPSIHLWRALVGWFGGFVTLLAATAILAPMNLGGAEVATGRVPGRGTAAAALIGRAEDPTDRLIRSALRILPIYAGLTLLLWVGLLILGEQGITALIHALGTLSTSGISGPTPLSQAGAALPGEMLIFAFFLFAVTRRAWPVLLPGRPRSALVADPELRLASLILVVLTALLFLRHFFIAEAAGLAGDLFEGLASLWGILFTAASFLTTTGYVSTHWLTAGAWSGVGTSGMVLMGLAIFGGGTATAAGGVKLLRVYALLRHGERELERVIHPSSIGQGGAERRRLAGEGAQIAWVFFMLFGISIAATVAALSLLGTDFESALVLAIASLTNTGPLADLGTAQPIAFGTLSDPVKAVSCLAMVVGRLEMLALLVLILPSGRRS
jgi:trk system potassium uptake protein TrkH